jgi:hypothetical protein
MQICFAARCVRAEQVQESGGGRGSHDEDLQVSRRHHPFFRRAGAGRHRQHIAQGVPSQEHRLRGGDRRLRGSDLFENDEFEI